MALDPRIPLGVQPVQTQQPNMLGQYAQIMAIKAAQQDVQGNEDLRNLFAGGANFDDPEFQRRGYAANPKQFQDLLGKRATTQKTEMEAIANEIKLRRDALSDVNTPEDYLSWHEKNHQGRVGSFFKSIGVNPTRESIMAQLSQPGGFAKLKQASALGATELEKKLMDEARALKVAGVGAAATMRGQDISAQTASNRLAFEKQKGKTIAGEGQFFREDAYGNLYPVQGFGAQFGPDAPAPAMPPAAANAFVTTRPPSVNALAPTAPPVVQPGLPTVANAAAIEAQQNVPRPRQPFTAPVPVIDKAGNTVLMQGREAVQTGATPATPATEARQVAIRKLPNAIAQSKDALNLINRMVGTPDGKTKPHEGFKGAVGAGVGLRFIPGTSESDFQSMYDQIQGGAFLQAFETLKGGGQITQPEGEKGTAAINRMKLATSEKEFITAARDFQAVLRRGIETAEKELRSGPGGGGGAAPADPLGIR